MPQTTVLTASRYTKLVRDVRKLIEEGKARAVAAANQELVQTYWHIGKRIGKESLTDNAGYNIAIIQDLAEELDIDYSTLLRCIQFFQTYNFAPGSEKLTWSHYKYLLPINNGQERQWYENLAETNNLNRAQLRKAIKDDRYKQFTSSKGGKVATAGLKRPTKPTYIYKAIVDRVIDGDTLLLRVDLGFQVWKEQRVRLAEIDTPAMDEPGGKEAYKFVLNQLAKVDFVMVKTNKIDIYGRYVGHIFYSMKNLSKDDIFSKGTYLNQELVEKGLARAM